MYLKTVRLSIMNLLALLIISTGCTTTEDFVRFTKAGTNYYASLDNLLQKSADIYINTNSERLISEHNKYCKDLLKLKDRNPVNIKLQEIDMQYELTKSYKQFIKNDETHIKIICDLRAHATLLGEYFDLINQLAASEAPERIGAAVGEIAGKLTEIGNTLRKSDIINQIPDPDIFTKITNIIVKAKIRKALKQELALRNKAIQTELITQRELLNVIKNEIANKLELTRTIREKRICDELYDVKHPMAHPNEWIADRREIVKWQNTVKELDAARNAANALNQSYKDLLSDEISLEKLNSFLLLQESLITSAGSINP